MDLAKILSAAKASKGGLKGMSHSELMELDSLLQELKAREDISGTDKWFPEFSDKYHPYGIDKLPKHLAAIEATASYKEVLVLGGNRSGKTKLGTYITSILTTGKYPTWWAGKRYRGPVHAWSVGKTSQSTRDTLQEALLGPVGALGTGMIAKELIGRTAARQGVANAIDTVEIKLLENDEWTGAWSTIGFKSNDQKAASFFGTAKHLVHIDEPCDELVYNESLIRTMKIDDPDGQSGFLIHTITPKEGLTRMLANFLAECDLLGGSEALPNLNLAKALMQQEASDADDGESKPVSKEKFSKVSRAAVTIGWDDVPWLPEKEKEEILAATPLHLRDTVSKGIPIIGSGAIYPVPLDEVLVDSFPIPKHFKRVYGMDVGWNKTAAIFLAYDPENDVVYITSEHYRGAEPPEIHAAAINRIATNWMPGTIDPASNGRGQGDGMQLIKEYRRLGLRLKEADNRVESGIHTVWSRLSTGGLKVFRETTPNWQNEYLLYRRNERGGIVKKDDHAMDAMRYAVTGLHLATYAPAQMETMTAPLTSGGRRYNV